MKELSVLFGLALVGKIVCEHYVACLVSKEMNKFLPQQDSCSCPQYLPIGWLVCLFCLYWSQFWFL